MRIKKVGLVCVPFGLGGAREGAELGPRSVMNAGILKQLESLGIEEITVRDVLCPQRPTGLPSGGRMRYEIEVRRMSDLMCEQVADLTANGYMPIVLGGDHSVAIGSLSGITERDGSPGVIWIDAHSDLNTEATSPSGNAHGMPLAVALGKAQFKLSGASGKSIRKEKLVLIAARDLDPGEKELIRADGIACFTMHDIDRLGMKTVMDRALEIAGEGTASLHVSLDMDSLDPSEAPGVGTPVPGGLSYREAHLAMELLAESGKVTSLDIVEVNPTLDSGGRTARLAVELCASLLGKTIL
ncbi:arginase [Cohnella thailandensis]|uniref:Arginase n=1 Tax=Cohnella thailandensis TaxID=557557 RepID=A0A841SUD2_9BACL|nr:arginase [Cohnella thailandensis]MBB6634862.1 arginase [Cohnella thailandensis]MBP1975916.1 arginase [Cohnella thailandensis]